MSLILTVLSVVPLRRVVMVFIMVSTIIMAPQLSLAADAVENALAARHEVVSAEQLEALAGGKEPLIKRLLVLRTQERPMFVGIRAEKALLRYSDSPEVAEALEQDVASPNMLGLARVVMVNIDQVPPSEVRQRLARAGIERAKNEAEFVPFARALADSKDPEISRLAQAAFR